jgi:hypothetical protein
LSGIGSRHTSGRHIGITDGNGATDFVSLFKSYVGGENQGQTEIFIT